MNIVRSEHGACALEPHWNYGDKGKGKGYKGSDDWMRFMQRHTPFVPFGTIDPKGNDKMPMPMPMQPMHQTNETTAVGDAKSVPDHRQAVTDAASGQI